MAIATGLTSDRMLAIEASSIVSGLVDKNGHLILTNHQGTASDAGSVVGPITTGIVTMYAGATAPNGWLLCDGSPISRVAYANLFASIGTTYGTGDGSTTFNLPNLKGKVPVGLDSAETEFASLGETGGEKTHTLSTPEMPAHAHIQNAHAHSIWDPGHNHSQNAHNHGVYDPGHGHSGNSHSHGINSHSHGSSTLSGFMTYMTGTATRQQVSKATGVYSISSTDINALGYGTTDSQTPGIQSTTASVNSSGTGVSVNNATPSNNSSGTGISINSTTATSQNTGDGGAHNNLQPYITMNYIIRY